MLRALDRQFAELEAQRLAVETVLDNLTPRQATYRIGDSSWTIPQVVDHVVRVERAVLAGARKPGVNRARWKRDLRKRILMWSVFTLGVRISVPRRVQHVAPDRDVTLDDARRSWIDVRTAWREFLETILPDQLGQLAIRHPLAGPFGYGEVLGFLNGHLRHHTRQIHRIRRSPGFPG